MNVEFISIIVFIYNVLLNKVFLNLLILDFVYDFCFFKEWYKYFFIMSRNGSDLNY